MRQNQSFVAKFHYHFTTKLYYRTTNYALCSINSTNLLLYTDKPHKIKVYQIEMVKMVSY